MGFGLNLDILSVGVTLAGNLVLGSIVVLSDRKSATSILFLLETIVVSAWSILNYLTYQITDLSTALWIERLVLFFAVPMSIIFVLLIYTFPKREWVLSRLKTYLVMILSGITMLLVLTPYVFSGVHVVPGVPTPQPSVAPGMGLFALVAVVSIPIGVYILIRKYLGSEGVVRRQFGNLLLGVIIMFACIIIFNFIFPTFFQNTRLIPLSALFTFPFVFFTFYAIHRNRLFNIKVTGTALLVFTLSVVTFVEVIFSNTLALILLRSSIFILVLVFGINLIRGVLREVEQREHIEKLAKELESANVRLKELDQLKNEFLSVASHQLRAPITAIRGYVANVLDGSYGALPDYLKDPLGVVQESTRVMVSSIEDYLNVSRIEQGRMKYEMAPVDVTAVAKRATDELAPLAQAKGLTLTFTESPSVTVTADFGKIKQVFTNLIDNAIKYTQQGGVTVSITTDDKVVRFMTSDTGVGIAPDEIGHLFEKFTRARDANQVNTTGTGLGLYVAKSLVEGQGGTIRIESDGVGKGSRFIVELPLASV
jgi:signal transduction histidine kinase